MTFCCGTGQSSWLRWIRCCGNNFASSYKAMKLSHLNLPVQNVASAIALFTTHFGFRLQEVKGDNAIAILHGRDGFTLVLMSAVMAKSGSTAYPDAFHIGFLPDSKEQVTTTWQSLKAGGIDAGREPAKIRDTFGFYFEAEGIMIEDRRLYYSLAMAFKAQKTSPTPASAGPAVPVLLAHPHHRGTAPQFSGIRISVAHTSCGWRK